MLQTMQSSVSTSFVRLRQRAENIRADTPRVYGFNQCIDKNWILDSFNALRCLSHKRLQRETHLYNSAVLDLVLSQDQWSWSAEGVLPGFRSAGEKLHKPRRSYYAVASILASGLSGARYLHHTPCEGCERRLGPFSDCLSVVLAAGHSSSWFAGGSCTNCAFRGCPEGCSGRSLTTQMSNCSRSEIQPFPSTMQDGYAPRGGYDEQQVLLSPQKSSGCSYQNAMKTVEADDSNAKAKMKEGGGLAKVDEHVRTSEHVPAKTSEYTFSATRERPSERRISPTVCYRTSPQSFSNGTNVRDSAEGSISATSNIRRTGGIHQYTAILSAATVAPSGSACDQQTLNSADRRHSTEFHHPDHEKLSSMHSVSELRYLRLGDLGPKISAIYDLETALANFGKILPQIKTLLCENCSARDFCEPYRTHSELARVDTVAADRQLQREFFSHVQRLNGDSHEMR